MRRQISGAADWVRARLVTFGDWCDESPAWVWWPAMVAVVTAIVVGVSVVSGWAGWTR